VQHGPRKRPAHRLARLPWSPAGAVGLARNEPASVLVTADPGCEDVVVCGDVLNTVRQFVAAWEAASALVAECAERTAAVTIEAFHKLASDPAVRAVLEGWRIAPVWTRRDCDCICAKSHPDDVGVCDKHAVITRRLTTDLDGDVDVPLCAPCAVAQGVAELAR
jgi:hypothetical protein